MAISLEVMADIYRRRARFYDYSANFYYLIGFREFACLRRAVAAFKLKPGDTVVENWLRYGSEFFFTAGVCRAGAMWNWCKATRPNTIFPNTSMEHCRAYLESGIRFDHSAGGQGVSRRQALRDPRVQATRCRSALAGEVGRDDNAALRCDRRSDPSPALGVHG